MLQRLSEFLISEVGLEPAYIAQRPVMLTLSLECRLRPRYYAVKFLKEHGLFNHNPSYSAIFKMTEKVFVERYICPHKEAAPHLTDDYVAACKGEVPTRFIFA
jgi:mTERF domain-containing protein